MREWFEYSHRSGIYDVTPETFHGGEDWVLVEASAMLGEDWMRASRGPIYFVFRVQQGKVASLRTYISKLKAFDVVGLRR